MTTVLTFFGGFTAGAFSVFAGACFADWRERRANRNRAEVGNGHSYYSLTDLDDHSQPR